jgi:hypothetical protein
LDLVVLALGRWRVMLLPHSSAPHQLRAAHVVLAARADSLHQEATPTLH